MTDYTELTEVITAFVKEHVKKTRFEHCLRVADVCVQLCDKFGLDCKKGYFIGVAHDMCKDFSTDKMLELAKKDGMPIYEMELQRPALLHGRAAAVMLKEEYGVDDEQLIEAVANHVSACPKMCDYTKILYIADKIEPGRDHVTKEYRKQLMELSLDEMIYKVIFDNYTYVKGRGFTIYPTTEIVISELTKKLKLE